MIGSSVVKNRTAHFVVETGYRIGRSIAWSAALGVSGVAMGVLMGISSRLPERREATPEEKKLRLKDRLIQNVNNASMIRQGLQMVIPAVDNWEYDARRQLEAMGYYPCQKCGIPHTHPEGEPNCLPPGAYWCEDLQRYVHVGHPDWDADEYKRATGQAWEDEGETVH